MKKVTNSNFGGFGSKPSSSDDVVLIARYRCDATMLPTSQYGTGLFGLAVAFSRDIAVTTFLDIKNLLHSFI